MIHDEFSKAPVEVEQGIYYEHYHCMGGLCYYSLSKHQHMHVMRKMVRWTLVVEGSISISISRGAVPRKGGERGEDSSSTEQTRA